MIFNFLDADFLALMRVVVWFFIPVYGSFLGLGLPLFTKALSMGGLKRRLGETLVVEVYYDQLLLFFGSLAVMVSYRGHADWALQGQIILAQPNVKLLFLVLFGLSCPLLTSTVSRLGALKESSLGFSAWHLGPTLAVI
jgi:hypothetical protein